MDGFPIQIRLNQVLYIINSDYTAKLKLYRGSEISYEIPSTIIYNNKAVPITIVGQDSFKDSNLEILTFSKYSHVSVIQSGAFQSSLLKKIILPKSLQHISKDAFYMTEFLQVVEVENGNKFFLVDDSGLLCSIHPFEIIFAGRHKKRIFIRESAKKIRNLCFEKCQNLIHISLPKSLELIGDCAFAWCVSLLYIRIPSNVKSIGVSCFFDCKSLRWCKFSADSQLMNLSPGCFTACERISHLIIPRNISIIKESCMTRIKKVTFLHQGVIKYYNHSLNPNGFFVLQPGSRFEAL